MGLNCDGMRTVARVETVQETVTRAVEVVHVGSVAQASQSSLRDHYLWLVRQQVSLHDLLNDEQQLRQRELEREAGLNEGQLEGCVGRWEFGGCRPPRGVENIGQLNVWHADQLRRREFQHSLILDHLRKRANELKEAQRLQTESLVRGGSPQLAASSAPDHDSQPSIVPPSLASPPSHDRDDPEAFCRVLTGAEAQAVQQQQAECRMVQEQQLRQLEEARHQTSTTAPSLSSRTHSSDSSLPNLGALAEHGATPGLSIPERDQQVPTPSQVMTQGQGSLVSQGNLPSGHHPSQQHLRSPAASLSSQGQVVGVLGSQSHSETPHPNTFQSGRERQGTFRCSQRGPSSLEVHSQSNLGNLHRQSATNSSQRQPAREGSHDQQQLSRDRQRDQQNIDRIQQQLRRELQRRGTVGQLQNTRVATGSHQSVPCHQRHGAHGRHQDRNHPGVRGQLHRSHPSRGGGRLQPQQRSQEQQYQARLAEGQEQLRRDQARERRRFQERQESTRPNAEEERWTRDQADRRQRYLEHQRNQQRLLQRWEDRRRDRSGQIDTQAGSSRSPTVQTRPVPELVPRGPRDSQGSAARRHFYGKPSRPRSVVEVGVIRIEEPVEEENSSLNSRGGNQDVNEIPLRTDLQLSGSLMAGGLVRLITTPNTSQPSEKEVSPPSNNEKEDIGVIEGGSEGGLVSGSESRSAMSTTGSSEPIVIPEQQEENSNHDGAGEGRMMRVIRPLRERISQMLNKEIVPGTRSGIEAPIPTLIREDVGVGQDEGSSSKNSHSVEVLSITAVGDKEPEESSFNISTDFLNEEIVTHVTLGSSKEASAVSSVNEEQGLTKRVEPANEVLLSPTSPAEKDQDISPHVEKNQDDRQSSLHKQGQKSVLFSIGGDVIRPGDSSPPIDLTRESLRTGFRVREREIELSECHQKYREESVIGLGKDIASEVTLVEQTNSGGSMAETSSTSVSSSQVREVASVVINNEADGSGASSIDVCRQIVELPRVDSGHGTETEVGAEISIAEVTDVAMISQPIDETLMPVHATNSESEGALWGDLRPVVDSASKLDIG